MISLLSLYGELVDKIAQREPDAINQARVKMLLYSLTSNLIFTTVCVLVYFQQGPILQFYRAIIAFVLAVAMLFTVARFPVWRQVSHFVCWALTLVVWSNLVLFVQGVNIPTLQFVFLIIVYSFYVHGLKWGTFYSFINILPIFAYILLDGKNYFSVSVPPQAITKISYIFVVAYNFTIIVFLHFHFFRAFNQNIVRITAARNEMNSLNEVLRDAMSALEKSSKAKMDFLSTMSHELRTPLNGVIGLTNIMLMEDPREDQKENLSVLKFSAENLLFLINDILDLNKLESDKIEMEQIPLNLPDLLRNSCAGLRLKAKEKKLDFRLKIDEELNGKLVNSDPTRITQILVNLLNNAIKFTEKGSVSLIAEVIDLGESQLSVRFTVEDTGIGIDESKQADIFEPFTQASKSTTRKFGGTGLGLAIVKRILELFNSQIHIKSTPGWGTSFWFDIIFDYTVSEEEVKRESPLKKGNLEGLRVLVAEDNLVNVMVIKKILSLWNIKPEVAENGAVAVEKMRESDFDVVLMDLHMPELDGYSASRAIRAFEDAGKSSIPIIALTASVSNAVDRKVIEAGMDGYLSKPFKPEHLYEKLMAVSVN